MRIKKKLLVTSNTWLQRNFNDQYVQKVLKKKLRSRAWFKLESIQKKEKIFNSGMMVLDIGAAPGGWSKYAAQCIQPYGNVFACDILPIKPINNVIVFQGDIFNKIITRKIIESINGKKIQVLMSDMAPNMSGISSIDMPKIMHIVQLILKLSRFILSTNGTVLVKIFQGDGFNENIRKIKTYFNKIKIIKPTASRLSSREVYILAKNYS